MAFKREKQRITSTDLLQALADGENIELYKCDISGNVDINRLLAKSEAFNVDNLNAVEKSGRTIITFGQLISIKACTFEEHVFFASPWSAKDTVDVVFKRDTVFNMSVFKGQTRFSGATFSGQAGFDGCHFESVASFTDVSFHGPAMFRTTSFEGYALFNNSSFRRDTRFTNTFLAKGGNFHDVKFDSRTDFSGVYSGSRSIPIFESVRFARWRYGEDETFWRFCKQAAHDSGSYRLSGDCFYNEMCAQLWRKFRGPNYDSLPLFRKILRSIWAVRLLPELIFGKFLFGYGERPIRVLFASLLIILTCGELYMSFGHLLHRDGSVLNPNFIDGLYFSTITFTTLGFGDIYPGDTFTKYLAMLEALSGACLVALFVVCLSKRFSRS